FGKALLMSAAVAVDDRESATTMMEALFSHAEESGGQLSFNEQRSDSYARLIDSPIRSNCTILSALIDYKRQWGDERFRDTPQKLMHVSVAQRNQAGYWPNSQENVFCVNAIRNYADEYEAPIEDLTGVLHWPGIEGELKAHFDARTAASEVLSGPDLTPGEAASLELGHEGNGRLYYNVRLDYVMPPNAVKAANAGMTVKRHYYVQRDSVWQPVTDKTALQRGDIVRIDLEVSTPTQRHHVVLTDPLPGAFEAVNRE